MGWIVRIELVLRQGWVSLIECRLREVVQPDHIPTVHAAGPLPYRVLLLGGGVAVGLGVTRGDRAMPGHLARHLASITGRGVDLEVAARLGMTLTGAAAALAQRELNGYDAVVLTLGTADALSRLPADGWRDQLEPLLTELLDRITPRARIVVLGAHNSSWSPYLSPRFTRLPGRRLVEFNRISREVCWALPRTSYLAPVSKQSTDVTKYAVGDYERVGRAVAAHLAQRLADQPPPATETGTLHPAADNRTLAALGLLGLLQVRLTPDG